jgi:hypothetical protein
MKELMRNSKRTKQKAGAKNLLIFDKKMMIWASGFGVGEIS